MSHSVRSHLRLDVADYDEKIRRWIPGYADMIRIAAESVASVDPERVVDLGAGTGALSEAVLEHTSTCRVEPLDVDPEMLERARARVSRFGDRARPVEASFDDPLGTADAFCASLSLHHIPTLERKAGLFGRIFEALRPGGVFANGDINMPEDAEARRALYRVWADHQVANGITEEEAWAHFEAWAEEDTYLPLEAELEALRSFGFEAERVWNEGPVGVVVARKRG